MKGEVCPSRIVIWYQLTPGSPRKMVIIISSIIIIDIIIITITIMHI